MNKPRNSQHGTCTAAVHAGSGIASVPPQGMSTPIYQSSTFDLDDAAYSDIAKTGGVSTLWYSRLGNPTVDAVARKLAVLENTESALLYSSGMAAISAALFALVPTGGHIVSAQEIYGDAFTLLNHEFPRHGRTATFVPVDDLDAWKVELAAGADVLYVETLSNPMLRLPDLAVLAQLAHQAGAIAVIDGTFTSPINVRPAEYQFDVVINSATKYLNGHSDLIAGVVAGSVSCLTPIRELSALLGGCLDPHAAFLLDRGIKTLPLRMERHNSNALDVAHWLSDHDDILDVVYPLLRSHPDHDLAKRTLYGGSGLVTMRVSGGDAGALRLMKNFKLIRQATSLGGMESLASAPFNTSHLGLTEAQRISIGILPGTIRLSVGIEDAEDIVADLEQAFDDSVEVSSNSGMSTKN